MWKRISTKIILKHPRLTVVEDLVELPNGTKTTYLRTPSKGNGATLIVEKNGKILLQKEYSYPLNEIIFQFPGGFVPKKENIMKGANRELMEESGLKSNKLELLGKYLMNNRRTDSYMYVFLATELESKSLPKDNEEEIETFWFSEKEIDKLILEGEFENGFSLAAWVFYKLRLQKN